MREDLPVNGFVAPTDLGWYRFLSARPHLTEVNFWRPGGTQFRALQPGEPFFFKLKAPQNAIGGFGIFARATRLPIWRVWEVFVEANGVASERELRDRIARLAGNPFVREDDHRMIGCVSIASVVFFAPDDWVAVPEDWRRNIVSGRGYDLSLGPGRRLWHDCLERAANVGQSAEWVGEALERERLGKPQVVRPRLGQASFRIAVLDAYGRACAVTTEHSLPVLEAAHIRPWSEGGGHEVRNGLPLRRDLHRLFDLGFVTVRPNLRVAVSPELRDVYENGRTYYALEGQRIVSPVNEADRPSSEFLEWHSDAVFRA